jgi:hypothetical protein
LSLSNNGRHPASSFSDIPSLVGRLPTITQPLRSAHSAVVNPTPPGQGPGQRVGVNLRKRAERAFRRNLHDDGSGPLQVRDAVEVADQKISLDQSTFALGHAR